MAKIELEISPRVTALSGDPKLVFLQGDKERGVKADALTPLKFN
jgi:hypothetical protein